MDSRFPLHASIPNQQTDELPYLSPPRATAASVSTGSPTQRNGAVDIPEPIHASRDSSHLAVGDNNQPPISPVSSVRPITNLVEQQPSNQPTPLLPTIPTLMHQTSFPRSGTTPLAFQHHNQNQVPVEVEFTPTLPSQDDAISPPPPPYTRYDAVAPEPKLDERRRPQLQMIDVEAAVRGLPRVSVMIATSGPSGSSRSGPSGPSGSSGPAPDQVNTSNPELPVQSANGSTFSANSSGLLLEARPTKEPEREKEFRHFIERRICGLKLWWIVVGCTAISVILSIVLGVTLGVLLHHRGITDYVNYDDDDNSPLLTSGAQTLVGELEGQNRTCMPLKSNLLGLSGDVGNVLWSCDIPNNTFQIDITRITNTELPDTNADPESLPRLPGRNTVILYLISAEQNQGTAVYEGMQPPRFYHQPLYEILSSNPGSSYRDRMRKRGSDYVLTQYEFRTLYTKKVVLRIPTIQRLLVDKKYLEGNKDGAGITNHTVIGEGEVVWTCKWEKTYLEGVVWMEWENTSSELFLPKSQVTAKGFTAGGQDGMVDIDDYVSGQTSSRKERRGVQGTPKLHYSLSEFRPTQQFLSQMTDGVQKGKISCEMQIRKGDVLQPFDNHTTGRRSLATRDEKEAVEDVVRRRFTRSLWRRESESVDLPSEKDTDDLACMCQWKAK